MRSIIYECDMETVAYIVQRLKPLYQSEDICHQIAYWILESITKAEQQDLLAQPLILTAAQEQELNRWLELHVDQRMPLQYLIGWVPFGPLRILVEPPVLIPRPETEEWCLRLCGQLERLQVNNIAILDLCTGSGCIALLLAHTLPMARVDATDIAEHALSLAKKNAAHNHIKGVHFFHSDIYDHIPADSKYDLIVANPPYISSDEWQTVEPSVTLWEDKQALLASNSGLDIIERIINRAKEFLIYSQAMDQKDIPQLVIEIGYHQADAVRKLLKDAGFTKIAIIKDLAGNDRVAQANI